MISDQGYSIFIIQHHNNSTIQFRLYLNIMVSLVGELDDNYGSIHDEELVFLLTTIDDGVHYS